LFSPGSPRPNLPVWALPDSQRPGMPMRSPDRPWSLDRPRSPVVNRQTNLIVAKTAQTISDIIEPGAYILGRGNLYVYLKIEYVYILNVTMSTGFEQMLIGAGEIAKIGRSVDDPIELLPCDNRKTVYPIGRPKLYEFYKKARRAMWQPEDIKVSKDVLDYARLSPAEQRAIDYILAFFAESDTLVVDNLASRFMREVAIPEVSLFYGFQIAIENIHGETYSILLDALIADPKKRQRLFDAAKNLEVIADMTKYITECTSSNASFAERILRMACVEGIFFSGCFCIIYWFGSRGLMHGLTQSNEYIARDEYSHTIFALMLYMMVKLSLPAVQIHKIFSEAVAIAKRFTNDAVPEGMPGMSRELMGEYIEYVADSLLGEIGAPAIYGTAQPFRFMDQMLMKNKTDFFVKKVTDYSHAGTTSDITFDDSLEY
jgi:ribonucleotide reductase beta subunit family protein with ferritin-like domain